MNAAATAEVTRDWKAVDQRLRELAAQQAALDFDIGRCLLQAERLNVHAELGYASHSEYAERLFGYSPRHTRERVRVAVALEGLPDIAAALDAGELSWSAVREVTRVAHVSTEREWLDAIGGKTVRDVEKMVAGLQPGQRPTDAPDPRLVRHVLRLELASTVLAGFREVASLLRRELGTDLSDEDVLAEACNRVLLGRTDEGRAPYQVALTRCESCSRVWRETGGEAIEVSAEEAEQACCDGQHIGSVVTPVDAGEEAPQPDRARQNITPKTRRKILRRDGGCRVPGCRNHLWLHLHHLQLVSEGGRNDPTRLITLCGTHHRHVHDGRIYITGDIETDARFFHADGTSYGEPPSPLGVERMRDAFSALRNPPVGPSRWRLRRDDQPPLGWGETESKQALAGIAAHVGRGATVPEIVREALRSRMS